MIKEIKNTTVFLFILITGTIIIHTTTPFLYNLMSHFFFEGFSVDVSDPIVFIVSSVLGISLSKILLLLYEFVQRFVNHELWVPDTLMKIIFPIFFITSIFRFSQ